MNEKFYLNSDIEEICQNLKKYSKIDFKILNKMSKAVGKNLSY